MSEKISEKISENNKEIVKLTLEKEEFNTAKTQLEEEQKANKFIENTIAQNNMKILNKIEKDESIRQDLPIIVQTGLHPP